jgi:hypothetical protein
MKWTYDEPRKLWYLISAGRPIDGGMHNDLTYEIAVDKNGEFAIGGSLLRYLGRERAPFCTLKDAQCWCDSLEERIASALELTKYFHPIR